MRAIKQLDNVSLKVHNALVFAPSGGSSPTPTPGTSASLTEESVLLHKRL